MRTLKLTNSALIVAFSLTTLLVVGLAGSGAYLWHKAQQYQAHSQDAKARYVRLAAISAQEDELIAANERQQQTLAQLLHPIDEGESQLRAQLQQQVSQSLTDAGMDIQRTRTQTNTHESFLSEVLIAIRFESSLPALTQALQTLQEQQPQLFVQDLTMQTMSGARAADQQIIQGEIRIVAYYNQQETP